MGWQYPAGPMELDDLRGWMKGEDCVVVGCGPSARPDHLPGGSCWNEAYEDRWTLGCNRMIPNCEADFAVCVEPPRDKQLWKIVKDSSPLIVFTHLESTPTGRKVHPRAVTFSSKDVRLWLNPGVEFDRDRRVRLGQSPFYAAALAVLLGFRTIGLIGVDLSQNRFPNVTPSNVAWQRLAILATGLGSSIVNLNPDSRLETIPKDSWTAIRTK